MCDSSVSWFLPCDALRCTVFVIVILSVCMSVCLSVTLVDCVHTVWPTIMIFSPYGSPIILVSGDIMFIQKFEGGHPEQGRWMRVGWVRIGDFRPISRRISKTVQHHCQLKQLSMTSTWWAAPLVPKLKNICCDQQEAWAALRRLYLSEELHGSTCSVGQSCYSWYKAAIDEQSPDHPPKCPRIDTSAFLIDSRLD